MYSKKSHLEHKNGNVNLTVISRKKENDVKVKKAKSIISDFFIIAMLFVIY